ncbi:MAG: hypothetical protein AAB645_01340 [Patescibacteria group bacterium]
MFKNEKETTRFITKLAATEITLLAIRATEAAAQFLLEPRVGVNDPAVTLEEKESYRVVMKHCRVAATRMRKDPLFHSPTREVKIDGKLYDTLGKVFPVVSWFMLKSSGRWLGPAWRLSGESHYIRVGNLHPGQIKFEPGTNSTSGLPTIKEIDQSKDSDVGEVDFSHL